MKKIILFSCILLGLAACGKESDKMMCGEYAVDITMSENGNKLSAVINGNEMTLNLAISASGARYVGQLNDTVVTLWNKGTDWTMFLNDGDPIFCVAK